jgi:hypothetical protein
MRIDLEELKKAIDWLRTHSHDLKVHIVLHEIDKLIIQTMDKHDNEVEIVLYTDSQMLPKIKRTEVLR